MEGRFDYCLKKSVYDQDYINKVKQAMTERGLEMRETDYGLFFLNTQYDEVKKIMEELDNDKVRSENKSGKRKRRNNGKDLG